MKVVYSELNFLMMSIQAEIENYDFDSSKIYWNTEEPFIKIKSDCHESVSLGYIMPTKKSSRGRKPKKQEIPKKFKSNVSFVLRKFVHREMGKKDNFTKTSVKCIIHANCEVIAKEYNIRIFNKGKIVCVGVLNEDKSDFADCINEVKEYIIRRKMEIYEKFKFPKQVYSSMKKILTEKYKIKNIVSTLENYQFSINFNIDLYKLKDFFIESSHQIINIDYMKLYKFFTDSIKAESFDFNAQNLISMLDRGIMVRKHIVSKSGLLDVLEKINLRAISIDFELYWAKFSKRHRIKMSENIKYSFLKQFVIYQFEDYKKDLDLLNYCLVESVIFKEEKNTLMVKKRKGNCVINIRIFGTGIINIQGGNSREISQSAYNDIKLIFEENKYKILYKPDNPPLVNFADILNEIGSDQKTNN